jgi:Transposase DDE domain
MVASPCSSTVPIPPPSYQRTQAKTQPALHLDALTLVTRLHLPALCRFAVRIAQRRCPPHLPAGPGGHPQVYSEVSLLLIALLRTLWRLSYQDMHDWLRSWSALALACGLPLDSQGQPRIPSASQQWKRERAAGAPVGEALLSMAVQIAIQCRLIGACDLIIDSAPILAWWRRDPDAQLGHAPAHHPRPLLRGYRVHTLLCRGSGLPLLFLLSPANVHDARLAQPLLAWAILLYRLRPRVIRLDAGYGSLHLIAWIHTVLGAVAVVPWNPKRQHNRFCLPPTWTAEELGKRTSIERFFGRVFSLFSYFRLQRPPLSWLVGSGKAGGLDLCCYDCSRPGCQSGRTSGSHSLPHTRSGTSVGISRCAFVTPFVTLARQALGMLNEKTPFAIS